MEDNNQKSILAFIIIGMAVLIILFVMIVIGTKKDKKSDDTTTTTTVTNHENKKDDNRATCEKTFSGYDNMTVSYLVEMTLKDDIVLSSKMSIKTVYKIEQDFLDESELGKNNPNVTFDKKNLTKLVLESEEDLTKDSNGNTMSIEYEMYAKPFEKQGYVCKK